MADRPLLSSRRAFTRAATGLAGILALGRAPAFAQTAPKKLILAHNSPPPETSAVTLDWFAKTVTERTHGAVQVDFQGGTILTKEIDIINAVKSGNISMGSPLGVSSDLFPEMGAFLIPYVVSSYDQAYRVLNGAVGDRLDQLFQTKYATKVVYFFDLGFRHVWNSRRPINEPRDLRGLKIRVSPSKILVDSVNGLGGVAVPMAFAEVITAAQQGVLDGGDLPVANMVPLKIYEVSKYFSLTYHNYAATFLAMNLADWKGLTAEQQKIFTDTGREAQGRLRAVMGSVDSLDGAKKLLEPKGMAVNAADLGAFKKLAQEKLWPQYQQKYPDIWQ